RGQRRRAEHVDVGHVGADVDGDHDGDAGEDRAGQLALGLADLLGHEARVLPAAVGEHGGHARRQGRPPPAGAPPGPRGGAGGRTVMPEAPAGASARAASAPSASVLPTVMMLTSTAPGLMPSAWNAATETMMPTASGVTAAGESPATRTTYSAHATATAA